ncbi:Toll-Interleukin-Resistance (TIR) domain family protein [Arabidopsis thaliana]|uniref:Disease resistance protein RBA1 n=1 Tax=Arabidopsis thaliana TaxID=3702 RepID=RBA1_ARATH|nr:Toll-Interleukin-Resistance (TIR) domain family protein [Arabidopsis thaliana]F4HT77.1 RecName: Full=Disease resistance protein RBA1; AltName: Full=NAD(+) hydrolase RBA1; AltName: Full=NADP(+) hydrolase RBA1; AltName: Full=Response to HopBA1 protein; Short=RBA1 [Arabidopsis thaliana]AEE32160.1 Toll-Interleukin-Resistance (TIR) domain family protein [Arabidopsis thaliana]|eukprot:NP_175170.1 Toll-Interleukin-Resistance (TIR) domain family protein [Arabidopsis thaliana]
MTSVSPRYRNVPVPKVFLSFRGEEIRHGFISHLADALERYGIMFIIDKDEQRGNDLTSLLLRIKESKVALVIFSSRFAESRFCMDEIVKMKECVDERKLLVIPIFYKVRARDVSGRTGDFGKKFWALAQKSRGCQIKEWMEALECISNKMGLSLGDGRSEADFIKEIVKEVERVLATFTSEDTEDHHCQTVKLLKGLVVGCLAHQELPLVLVFTQVYYYVKFSIFFIEEIFSSCFRKGFVLKPCKEDLQINSISIPGIDLENFKNMMQQAMYELNQMLLQSLGNIDPHRDVAFENQPQDQPDSPIALPEERRVALEATKFCGHAAYWWNQTKTTRARIGKVLIHFWEKLKKKFKDTYDRTVRI